MELPSDERRLHPLGMRLWTWCAPDGWRYRRADWEQVEGETPRGSLMRQRFAPGTQERASDARRALH